MVQVWGASIRSWRYGWLKKKRSMHLSSNNSKVVPQFENAFSWCVYNSNVTMVFVGDISNWYSWGLYTNKHNVWGHHLVETSPGGEKDGKSVMNIL